MDKKWMQGGILKCKITEDGHCLRNLKLFISFIWRIDDQFCFIKSVKHSIVSTIIHIFRVNLHFTWESRTIYFFYCIRDINIRKSRTFKSIPFNCLQSAFQFYIDQIWASIECWVANRLKGFRKIDAHNILIFTKGFSLYASDTFGDNNILWAIIVTSNDLSSVFIIPQATASLNSCDIFEVLESFILHVIRQRTKGNSKDAVFNFETVECVILDVDEIWIVFFYCQGFQIFTTWKDIIF